MAKATPKDGGRKVVTSTNADTGNPQRTVTKKNIVGRPVMVTKSTDEYGRQTKDRVTKNPYTGTVKVKSKTKGGKTTVAKYEGTPTKVRGGNYSSPKGGEFNNQPK
jgi:predicted nucleotide-binding protein